MQGDGISDLPNGWEAESDKDDGFLQKPFPGSHRVSAQYTNEDHLLTEEPLHRSYSLGNEPLILEAVDGPAIGFATTKLSVNSSSTGTNDKASSTDEAPAFTFLLIKLRPGVSRLNMISLFLVYFVVTLTLVLLTAFVTYLLEDVYDITGSRTAEVAGNLGFYADIGVICTEFLMGSLQDLIGRRVLLVSGLLIVGFSIAGQPLPSTLAGLYFFRIMASVGVIPALYTPYTIDYVHRNSLGLVAGYQAVLSTIASLISESGAIEAQKVFPVQYIYFALGGFILLTAIFAAFGLKDVHNLALAGKQTQHDSNHEEEMEIVPTSSHQVDSTRDKCRRIFTEFKSTISTEMSIVVGFASSFSTLMTYIATLQYAVLIFNQSYADDKASKDYISDQLSLYFLVSQMITMVLAVMTGILADKIKVWTIMLWFHALMLSSLILFVVFVQTQDSVFNAQVHQSSGMTVGFICMSITSSLMFSLNQAILGKAISNCTMSRGVFLGAQAFSSSSGVILIDAVGGRIYESNKRNPFYICIGGEIGVILLILVLAAYKKLHI